MNSRNECRKLSININSMNYLLTILFYTLNNILYLCAKKNVFCTKCLKQISKKKYSKYKNNFSRDVDQVIYSYKYFFSFKFLYLFPATINN